MTETFKMTRLEMPLRICRHFDTLHNLCCEVGIAYGSVSVSTGREGDRPLLPCLHDAGTECKMNPPVSAQEQAAKVAEFDLWMQNRSAGYDPGRS